ncbi:endochitinase A-like isoform X2 [Strongylocentrotus purpuratus]|uniref:EMI domain-containing protein n=1 Tax=Strongylocentrotus purpuratus TaxID=7668 RepID=A0A7M7T5H6_STRPU|nr:endochitinase A-like isoform X2 [Strongylocentrotus purpuratus]
MDSWSLSLLLLVCLSSLTSSIAQDGRCTKKVSRVVFYTETFTKSSTEVYYEKCGFLYLARCTRYRTVYSVGSRRPSRIGYVSDYECCPGWITEGTNCLPTQPPTTEAVTTTARPTTTKIPTTATTTTTSPSTTSRFTSSHNSNNNGDTQRHSRTRTSTTASPDNHIETSPVYVGGQGKSASLLSSRPMMMGISAVAVVVFLAMSIGGVVCGVRKFCPKKKPVGRMENESPTRRDSEGIQTNGTVPNGAVGHGDRPKLKQKVKGHKGKLTATSNPGYDIMDLADTTQESSYEAIDPEAGPLKPHKFQKDAKGFECVNMSDLMPSSAKHLQTSPVKGRRPIGPAAVTENEYTAFADEPRTSPEPSQKKTVSKDNNNHRMGESMVGQRKPLPKPKPFPKTRRNPQPVEGSSNTCAPPSAANHLVAPPAVTAQYLDMSKGQTSPPTNVDRRICEREGASPRKPIKKFPSLEESPKSSIEDCTVDFRSNLSGLSSGNSNLYDHVGETRSEPTSRRGSEAKHAFATQGMYVLPGDLSPAITKKLQSVADEKMTCTYVLGDDVPGLAPRSPLFSDSYGPVGSNHDMARDSANELSNPYDVVVTPENRRKMLKPVITKRGYAEPRQDSMDQDSYYENQRRSTASLPNNSRKLSLPVQPHEDEEVYDFVEVKDSRSTTTGRPPKVAPKKPVLTSGQESQKAKEAIGRSRSGPSLLRYAELDSVYVNTSRF